MVATILIIEDEPDLVQTLEYNLKREGYRTRSALTAQAGLEAIKSSPAPSLVLLDIMLPDLSGNDICRQIRQCERTQHIPIIMLTAKGEAADRVAGLEAGADDYVVKPFNVRELLLRIRAVLKRIHNDSDGFHNFEALRLDIPAHRAWVNDDEIKLTALEFKLLVTLFERRGQVQSREVLLNDVWEIEADIMTRTVDTHIKRLREKLGVAGDYIETTRGVGYRFKASLS